MVAVSAANLDKRTERGRKNVISNSTEKSPINAAENFKQLNVKKESLSSKKITFDFPNTDLKVFANFVAQLSGKILIGEDLLKGNINIKSQRNMDSDEVKQLFNALLSTQGLEYVETENSMEIIQISDSYVKVYELKYLKADDLAKSLAQMFRMSFKVGNNPVNIQITAVAGSNALMVLAPKNQQVEIEEAIKKMDVEVHQVLLDVLVVELSTTISTGFGVNARYGDNAFSKDTTGITSGVVTNPPSPTIDYNYNFGDWAISVNAADSTTKLKVLSQPRVIAVENQKSQIKIDKKQPYANGSTSQKSGEDTSSTTTTTTEEVGIDLTITPRINTNKDVTLDLKLSITSIVDSINLPIGVGSNGTTTIDQTIPIIGHRIVNNVSVVQNGKTLVIGGLLDNQKTLITTAPPVLGDLPWLGFMFAKTTEATVQKELLIYITPTVIENVEQQRSLTKIEIQKLRNYDSKETDTIDQMLTGKKTETDDTFNLFDYFSRKEYREKQNFIPQPENL